MRGSTPQRGTAPCVATKGPRRAKHTAHRAPARAYRVQGTEQRALPNSQSPREGEKGTELREVNRAPNVISHARCPWRLRRNKRTAK